MKLVDLFWSEVAHQDLDLPSLAQQLRATGAVGTGSKRPLDLWTSQEVLRATFGPYVDELRTH